MSAWHGFAHRILRRIKLAGAVSPTRLLEMLSDRFGAFEAIATSSIKLARVAPEEELAMEPLTNLLDQLRRRRTQF
jgi:hypothetical protein